MSTFAISFSIDYDSSKSYDERYDSLMAAIRRCPKVWVETTSFCLVQSSEKIEDLELRLYCTKFDATKDKILVVDVSYDTAIARGAFKDTAKLRELLPGIQKK